jgi:outer membrane protein OmpA-like peptidoglycan-associated protein
MKANPSMRIEISGHNDAKEDRAGETNEEYQDMARKRVAAVSKYFVTQGIDKTRLVESFKGAGVPNPEIDGENDDDELKDAKNRRVNFKIIK